MWNFHTTYLSSPLLATTTSLAALLGGHGCASGAVLRRRTPLRRWRTRRALHGQLQRGIALLFAGTQQLVAFYFSRPTLVLGAAARVPLRPLRFLVWLGSVQDRPGVAIWATRRRLARRCVRTADLALPARFPHRPARSWGAVYLPALISADLAGCGAVLAPTLPWRAAALVRRGSRSV